MKIKSILTMILAVIILGIGNLQAQTSAFTYQGQFEDSSVPQPTNGTYDMEFALFDSESNGAPIGSPLMKNGVQIVNGIFSVSLDFGNSALDGSQLYLEITVFDNGTPVILSPRTLVNSSPYAFQANKATTADNTNNVGTKTRLEVANAVNDVQAATANNTSNTIVKRGSGGAINVGNVNINGVPISGSGTTLTLGTSNTTIRFGNILFGAGFIELCVLTPTDLRLVGCASSLRYKKDILPFTSGMSIINQLEPISYTWKTDGSKDTGFGAEDVEKINPLFVTYNQKGEVEGVRYKRLSVLFVNAFKEQQAEIKTLKKDNQNLQTQLDGLKQLVCAANVEAAICKENQ